MSAVVIDNFSFRAFQNAVKQAARVGVPREKAVRLVAEDIKQGQDGFSVAGQLQQRAMRQAPRPFPGGDAA